MTSSLARKEGRRKEEKELGEEGGGIKGRESNYELQWEKSTIIYIKALPVYFHRLPDILTV